MGSRQAAGKAVQDAFDNPLSKNKKAGQSSMVAPTQSSGGRVLAKSGLIPQDPASAGSKAAAEPEDEVLRLFMLLDEDGSGALDKKEVKMLAQKLGDKLKPKDLRDAFARMDRDRTGDVSLENFRQWWKAKKGEDRRELRSKARELFNEVDDDHSGNLDRDEVRQLAAAIKKKCGVILDPPFDLDVDFEMMDVNHDGVVNFPEFEAWLRSRTGDDDADIPVLPESMVHKINNKTDQGDEGLYQGAGRNGKELWAFLRPRLKMLVAMTAHYGSIHDMYAESAGESLFEEKPLPKGINHPDGKFASKWDIAQIFALFYVAYLVPLRTGFDITIEVGVFLFYVDMIVDIYFIVDLYLNFRTAYWRADGMLEDGKREIAYNYFRGWFTIDFVSCIPIQYVAIIYGDDGGKEAGQKFKAFKVLRLLRLAKLLRLARIKKLIEKYEDTFDAAPFLGLVLTLFGIAFASHMLACFWYYVGTTCSVVVQGKPKTCGWVINPSASYIRPWVKEDIKADKVGIGTRYVASMYTIMVSEFAYTDAEFSFSIFATLVVGFIYGALAGIMTTMMASASAGEQEYQAQIASLKAWMKARDLEKKDSKKILAYYRARSSGNSTFDEASILNDMPPSLAGDITQYLYGRFVKSMPMFRNLGKEVTTHLCTLVTPVTAIKGQTIINQGQVGSEMYFIISGEVEVLRNAGSSDERLGFLGEGSFFGEAAMLEILFYNRGNGAEIRQRSVRATSGEVQLGYITRIQLEGLLVSFPELEIRLRQFSKYGNARFSNKGSTKESIAALKASMPSGGKSQSEYGDVSVADELATRHRQRAAQIVALQSAMAADQKALVAALRRAGVAK